jgi:hypothetical protein
MMFAGGPGDVDASGLSVSDAGVTSAPTIVVEDADSGGECQGLECQRPVCEDGGTTTLVGQVFDPAGVNGIADAYVYIPLDPSGTLPPLVSGANCQPCTGDVAFAAVSAVRTAADGTFTLPNVPSTQTAPHAPIPLVVQKGKWRREAWLGNVPACATTQVDPLDSHLPTNRFDGAGDAGDIPKMAIATGNLDALECMLYKAGVDPGEFQVPAQSGSGRIDTYLANGDGLAAPSGAAAPSSGIATGLSSLVDNLDTLLSYDAVLFPCEGERNIGVDPQGFGNVVAYANAGGRLLTTHLGSAWLTSDVSADAGTSQNPFSAVATWNPNPAMDRGSEIGIIDSLLANGMTSAVGSELDQWLLSVGAVSTNAPWQISVVQPGGDVGSVNQIATEWVHDSSGSGEPFALGFDTPLPNSDADAGSGSCGRVLYGDFHGEPRVSSGLCATGAMTAQESLLEYMFFELTTCVQPDSRDPPLPTRSVPTPAIIAYAPTSFTEDFTSPCPPSTRVVWRALSWNATIPPTASISFSAQTVDLPGDGGSPDFSEAQSIALLTATTSTSPPGYEILLDINSLDAGVAIGAFARAVPPVESKGALRLTFTLTPTSDGLSAPVLASWQVTSDCLPSE